MSKTGTSIDSYSARMISIAAEDKVNNNPSLSKLTNHERIVSMNQLGDTYVSPIEDTKYTERNYLARKVVKPSEIKGIKGGEVIDFLHKPTSFACGNRNIPVQGPLYQKDKDKAVNGSRFMSPVPEIDISSPKSSGFTLPELVASPKILDRKIKSNRFGQAKTMMEVT